jgi:cytochrome c oxidase subunit 2
VAVAVVALAGCGGGGSAKTQTNGGSRSSSASSNVDTGGAGAAGKQLFASNGCSGCHTLKAAGSTGTTGPDLDTQLPKDAKAAGKDIKAFAEESIVKPNAYIAKGYSANIMPQSFGQSLSKADLQKLVSFITGSG